MPAPSMYLAVNARISVTPHFLRTTSVFGRLRELETLDAPRSRVFGTITEPTMVHGRPAWMIKLDLLPDRPFALLPGCLRYEGPRERQVAPEETTAEENQQEEITEDPDLLEDAVAVPGELGPEIDDAEAEIETIDATWIQSNVDVDARQSRPLEAFHGHTLFHLPSKEHASPAQYFLRFLPEDHIQDVVLPAINHHAASCMNNFEEITYDEYLIWIALFVIMTTANLQDRSSYWHEGDSPFVLNINFSSYMSMKRFNFITEMHVYIRPDAQL